MEIIAKQLNEIVSEIEKERSYFKNCNFLFKRKLPIFKGWLEEIKSWMERDPIKTFREKLIGEGTITEEEDRKIKKEIERKIEAAIEFGIKGKLPKPAEALALLR